MKIKKIVLASIYTVTFITMDAFAQMSPHRIAIREGNYGGEFYDTVTNQVFIPRGFNYIRLAGEIDPWSGEPTLAHSTFTPNYYDPAQANAALAQWHYDGENTVRVFLDELTIGDPDGGLSTAYLSNVANFLIRAKAQEIYTQLTLTNLPMLGGYYVENQNPTQIESENWFYLSDEGVDAKKRYVRDLIMGLQTLGAPLDYVFSYNISNEMYYLENAKPLALTSGLVITPTGAFNMASSVDRQQMMDSNMVRWINEVRDAARAVDPTALVAPGFFAPSVVEGADPRITRTYWAIADASIGGSSADFIDLHSYPRGQSLSDDIASFEISTNKKPLIMGEFGAFKDIHPYINYAAYTLRDWQTTSCLYGFDGWLMWTWDTYEQPELWNAEQNFGAINGQLAPIARPDPCQ